MPLALGLSALLLGGAADPQPVAKQEVAYPAPGEIVAAAPAADWVEIAAKDLLIMDLAPDAKGKTRRVVIQLMPAPFSQGWIGNIRKLAAARWWDGTAVVRVQDNYVAQWGDPTEKKPLPEGMEVMSESGYTIPFSFNHIIYNDGSEASIPSPPFPKFDRVLPQDSYSVGSGFIFGWPVGIQGGMWPTHCYGMVGVGRNLSPDTGTGAELYTVIGHAPRHLDRNIALVGRIIEGVENLSSLPRGTGDLGFYLTPEERTPIVSVRLGNEVGGLPAYEYLSTESKSFTQYADARANRRDPFFIRPAGGADICNIPVPVRRKKV